MDIAAEMGYLFGTFVDQEGDDARFGVGRMDRGSNRFENLGLPGLGRGDNQAAGAFADGGQQVNDPHGHIAAIPQLEAIIRIDGY